jgi:hypothetical protein
VLFFAQPQSPNEGRLTQYIYNDRLKANLILTHIRHKGIYFVTLLNQPYQDARGIYQNTFADFFIYQIIGMNSPNPPEYARRTRPSLDIVVEKSDNVT